MRIWDSAVNLIMSTAIVCLLIALAFYLEPVLPLSGSGILTGAIPVFLTVYVLVSKSSTSTGVSRKFRSSCLSFFSWVRSSEAETEAADADSPSYLGQATPRTLSESSYDQRQFRPYEVLDHMGYRSRNNLVDDAWTQTLEMWQHRRPEDYTVFMEDDSVGDQFETELMPDENGILKLTVIPVYSSSRKSEGSDSSIVELAEDLRDDFHNRIVDLASLHDEFEPQIVDTDE